MLCKVRRANPKNNPCMDVFFFLAEESGTRLETTTAKPLLLGRRLNVDVPVVKSHNPDRLTGFPFNGVSSFTELAQSVAGNFLDIAEIMTEFFFPFFFFTLNLY